jgi:hypothetical protein
MFNAHELFNQMLSDACPSYVDEDGVMEFTIELHCVTYHIFAIKTHDVHDTNGEWLYAEYEVRGYTVTQD